MNTQRVSISHQVLNRLCVWFCRHIQSQLARCDGRFDALFPQALAVVISTGNFSISHLQRRFLLGYGRACRLMKAIRASGVILADNSSCVRKR